MSEQNRLDYGNEKQTPEKHITNEEIKDTPFRIIHTEEIGWFAALGQHRVTETFKTKKEVEKEIDKPTWRTITNVMVTIATQVQEIAERAKTAETKSQPTKHN